MFKGVFRLILMSGLCEYKPGARIPESGVKAGSKLDPKTFKSSSNLDIKISAVQSSKVISLLVRSSFLF